MIIFYMFPNFILLTVQYLDDFIVINMLKMFSGLKIF